MLLHFTGDDSESVSIRGPVGDFFCNHAYNYKYETLGRIFFLFPKDCSWANKVYFWD